MSRESEPTAGGEPAATLTDDHADLEHARAAGRTYQAGAMIGFSFKYDVGIYAVGALGTTVMLFVNALVGGLLTLAAPILAIVLKSKIAGDIRIQAKEKVPAAVLKAAEAMRPHFDKVIDDFAKRLSEFVSNAGNTLYKGISEILDRTMSERREHGTQIGDLRTSTSTQISQVHAAKHALGQLRESLWASEAGEPAPAAPPPAPGA